MSAHEFAANLGEVASVLAHAPFVGLLFVLIVAGALAVGNK